MKVIKKCRANIFRKIKRDKRLTHNSELYIYIYIYI